MCGIFGIVYKSKNRHVLEETVKDSIDTMLHRGPDGWGIHVDGNMGFGHRRLSIIDLNTGEQPIYNERGNVGVVYNGEIYNYLDVRKTLIGYGHSFYTNTDTEVIIHAYEQWGYDCINRFNGMFAWVLWDKSNEIVWVVRDRLGIKPLYYVETEEGWCFASEVKAILKSKMIKCDINEKVLDAYFTLGYTPGPETIFKDIQKVRPGHYLIIRNGELNERLYWDFNETSVTNRSYIDCSHDTLQLLNDSVKKRLVSDVPLGAFLSGGIDSSAVTALMNEHVVDPIKTFTVGYKSNDKYSEIKYASQVADKLQTDHNEYLLDDFDFFETLNTFVKYSEEPIVEPAGIALYRLAQMAKEEVTVILSGEGSDEIFAGYHIYGRMAKIDKIRKVIPNIFLKILEKLPNPVSWNASYAKNYDWLTSSLETRFQGTSAILTNSNKDWLYSNEYHKNRGSYLEDTFRFYFDRVKNKDDILSKMLYIDAKTWLVDNLFLKADKMTMAASLELRVPFMDHRLVEQTASYPSYFKISNNSGKLILKKIMKEYLPKNIINRTKMGFPVPTSDWLKGDMYDNVYERFKRFSNNDWLSKKAINKLLMTHKSGHQDLSRMIMTILVLDEWLCEFGGN